MKTRWSLVPGGLAVVDFMKLATLHGALSATGHAVHGDAVLGKKLVEIDVLSTESRDVISEMDSRSFHQVPGRF